MAKSDSIYLLFFARSYQFEIPFGLSVYITILYLHWTGNKYTRFPCVKERKGMIRKYPSEYFTFILIYLWSSLHFFLCFPMMRWSKNFKGSVKPTRGLYCEREQGIDSGTRMSKVNCALISFKPTKICGERA